MSEEMHATKAEPVLLWQTKEELQRWKSRVEEEQRRKPSVEDGKKGRKREIKPPVEKVELEATEGKRRKGTRSEEQSQGTEEVNTKVEGGVREGIEKSML